ncbi:hypothetical protein [Rhizobium azibense]|uniref:hypothetical protein n=1 Tax=Rhizobium azibense TaxID=1136135 RepID=UPI0014045C5B|nr:hypothetical protein [Rhizobium azibense]
MLPSSRSRPWLWHQCCGTRDVARAEDFIKHAPPWNERVGSDDIGAFARRRSVLCRAAAVTIQSLERFARFSIGVKGERTTMSTPPRS